MTNSDKIASSVILPLVYLPPIDWFLPMLSHEVTWIDITSPYKKQSYRNRCYIMTSNGILPLTIPVQRSKLNQDLSNVKIDYTKAWRRVHWRAIESAYNRSPFFLFYRDTLAGYYTGKRIEHLADWNLSLVKEIMTLLRLERKIIELDVSKQEASTEALDLRHAWHPKVGHRYAPDHYQPYRQVFAEKFGFETGLSILDVLFNLGPEAVAYLEVHGMLVRPDADLYS